MARYFFDTSALVKLGHEKNTCHICMRSVVRHREGFRMRTLRIAG